MGAAWAHLVCYGSMVVLSYGLGRRYYPVPYDVWRVLGYIAFGIGLYLASRWLVTELEWHTLMAGTACMALFLVVVGWEAWRLRRRAAVKAA
jgi:hypothetical protein